MKSAIGMLQMEVFPALFMLCLWNWSAHWHKQSRKSKLQTPKQLYPLSPRPPIVNLYPHTKPLHRRTVQIGKLKWKQEIGKISICRSMNTCVYSNNVVVCTSNGNWSFLWRRNPDWLIITLKSSSVCLHVRWWWDINLMFNVEGCCQWVKIAC